MSMTAISSTLPDCNSALPGVHNPLEDVMSKSTLTRRALVASTAAVPAAAALGLPAIALAAAEPDPIFALVERLKEARAANDKACIATDEARDRFADKYGSEYPDAFSKELRAALLKEMPGTGLHKCHSKHEQIDNCRGIFPDDILEMLHEELTHQTNAYEETVRPFEDMQEQAEKALDDAIDAILRTPPTTMAGLAFVLACAGDESQITDFFDLHLEYGQEFISTLATAAGKLARAA